VIIKRLTTPCDLNATSYHWAVDTLGTEGSYLVLSVPAILWDIACAIAKDERQPPFLVCLPDEMVAGWSWSVSNGVCIVWSNAIL
jgi:hypothetical protein